MKSVNDIKILLNNLEEIKHGMYLAGERAALDCGFHFYDEFGDILAPHFLKIRSELDTLIHKIQKGLEKDQD